MTDIDKSISDLDPETDSRRHFLYYATAGAGTVATGAAVWPLSIR